MPPNVLNIAVEGDFDACQELVKAMFADAELRRDLRLSAVNSINWARVAAQAVYYVWAGLRLGAPDRPVAFAVPTGNFGNVYAGRVAAAMGLPVARLIVATNENDILARFFAQPAATSAAATVPTTSPSMDIQVASNFERLLLELEGGDADRTRGADAGARPVGRLRLRRSAARPVRRRLGRPAGGRRHHRRHARMLLASSSTRTPPSASRSPPTTAPSRGVPLVTLATAHPAKFPDAVEAACGVRPALPARYADLMTRDGALPAGCRPTSPRVATAIRETFGPA